MLHYGLRAPCRHDLQCEWGEEGWSAKSQERTMEPQTCREIARERTETFQALVRERTIPTERYINSVRTSQETQYISAL
jgi:hypothetical protein